MKILFQSPVQFYGIASIYKYFYRDSSHQMQFIYNSSIISKIDLTFAFVVLVLKSENRLSFIYHFINPAQILNNALHYPLGLKHPLWDNDDSSVTASLPSNLRLPQVPSDKIQETDPLV